MRGGKFTTKDGNLNLHQTRGTHSVLYIKEYYFDPYGSTSPKMFTNYIIKKNWKSDFSP